MKQTKSNKKHAEYEFSAQRRQVLSIRTCKSDSQDDWDTIVTWLKGYGEGDAKKGLYKLAQDNDVLPKSSDHETKGNEYS